MSFNRSEYNHQYYLNNKERFHKKYLAQKEKEAKDPELRKKRKARDSANYFKRKANKKTKKGLPLLSDKELARLKYRDMYARRKENNGRQVNFKYPRPLPDKLIQEMILRDESRRVQKVKDSIWLTKEEKIKKIKKIWFPNSTA